MLSEEKIRIMIKLADYEKGKGKTDLYRTGYYKSDYIRKKVLKTILEVTLAFVLLTSLFIMYRMEFIIDNALKLNYSAIGIQVIIIYILLIILFSVITVGTEIIHYEESKKRVKQYYGMLKQLLDYYNVTSGGEHNDDGIVRNKGEN